MTERTRIEKKGDGIAFSEDDGKTWNMIDGDTLVSMNMWGFTHSMLDKSRIPGISDQGTEGKSHEV